MPPGARRSPKRRPRAEKTFGKRAAFDLKGRPLQEGLARPFPERQTLPTSARAIAFQALVRAERTDAYLNLALDAAFRAVPGIDQPDRALATELVYGVCRHQRALDAAIAGHASRPPERLDPEVRAALRLGAYQLLFMRMKPHAAVHETVELVKGLPRLRHAAGFVNALLRAISRMEAPASPQGTPAERLAVECSQPTWLVERWIARLGFEEAAALCASQNEVPRIDIRVDPQRISRDALAGLLGEVGIAARPTPISPVGLRLDATGNLAALPAFSQGLFQVQDEAAQLVGLLPRVEAGMRVLDACAAPGGKSCHLAERLGASGRVHALDLHAHRLRRIEEEARRLGLGARIEVRAADASAPLPFDEASFDLILADLPCTGLGTLRRHPEIRYRRAPGDPARLAALQRAIAQNLARYLKPGGQFIYAVCSMEPEEGVEQLEALSGLGLDLAMPDEAAQIAWPIEDASAPFIATFPHRQGCDGFFGARLIRRG